LRRQFRPRKLQLMRLPRRSKQRASDCLRSFLQGLVTIVFVVALVPEWNDSYASECILVVHWPDDCVLRGTRVVDHEGYARDSHQRPESHESFTPPNCRVDHYDLFGIASIRYAANPRGSYQISGSTKHNC